MSLSVSQLRQLLCVQTYLSVRLFKCQSVVARCQLREANIYRCSWNIQHARDGKTLCTNPQTSSSSSSSSCSGRIRFDSCSLYPQNEIGPSTNPQTKTTIFLGAFAKFWKATISFIMSVCLSARPSVCPSLCPHRTPLPLNGFLWNLVFNFFQNSVEKIQV
jgi:hypothetical protein